MEKKSKVNSDNFILIQGWMLSELQLKGNELLIYAIIYRFSLYENQTYHGGLQYLADWTNFTKRGVINNLNSLINKGLIAKKESIHNGVNLTEYYATKFNGGSEKFSLGDEKSSPGVVKNFHWGSEKISPNTINNNNNNIYITKKDISNDISKESDLSLQGDKELAGLKEINQKQEKPKASPYLDIIRTYTNNHDLQMNLEEYVKSRKQLKKPLTEYALKLALTKLDTLGQTDSEKIKVLQQSISNSWLGLFPVSNLYDSDDPDDIAVHNYWQSLGWDENMIDGMRVSSMGTDAFTRIYEKTLEVIKGNATQADLYDFIGVIRRKSYK